LIAADAGKGAGEAEAATFGALAWVVGLVLSVSVLAFAACSPGVDVEPFSSWEPPLANFLWSTRNEGEPFARTLVAVGDSFLLRKRLLVRAMKMPAEASGAGSDSKAVICGSRTSPSDVHSCCFGLLSVLELPGQHLLCSWSYSNLRDALQDGRLIVCLCQHPY